MKGLSKLTIGCFLLFFIGTFSSCYKKDLEEFKKASFELNSTIALPLFNANISLKDSLLNAIPNFSVSDSLYLINDISMSDSISLSLEGYSIREAQLKLYLKNNFPVRGSLQVYFLNDNDKIQDSLFVINKHPVQFSSNGITTVSDVYLYLDEVKYKKMIESKKIKIVYSIKKGSLNEGSYQLFVGCGLMVRTEKRL